MGPVHVKELCLVDEFQDFSRVHARSSGRTLNNDYNALYAEYLFRAKGVAGDWITYHVPDAIHHVKLVAIIAETPGDFTLETSADGVTFNATHGTRAERRYAGPSGRRRTRPSPDPRGI